MTGEGGVLYGAGLGYRIPETWELVDLFASLGAGQSYGRLTDEGGEAVDRTFVISEVQALFLAEFPLFEWGGLYAGARFYYGKNRLESAGEPDLHGEREGNIGGVFGARFRPTERVTVTAEYGNGHTRIYSIGTIIALSE
jgi:hypothetical protein